MIHVTQGHEAGIGLEVFFKAFLRLHDKHDQFILYANIDSIMKTIKSINIQIHRENDKLILNDKTLFFQNIKDKSLPQSTSTLLEALKNLDDKEDILFTLPTSKDQLINPDDNLKLHGYTEFLRHRFKIKDLAMSFLSPQHTICLVTDHIPLKDVANTINSNLIVKKVTRAIETIKGLRSIKNVFLAGINPHCGEAGLLGTEDKCIINAVETLKSNYPGLNIKGPIPGDTVHFHHQDQNDLLVYMYHDQGLAPFKFINKLIGINLTCGLPFIRVSVDHGTSFDLYGKNAADPCGCLYLMRELLK